MMPVMHSCVTLPLQPTRRYLYPRNHRTKGCAVTRWKAIGLLILSIALVASTCQEAKNQVSLEAEIIANENEGKEGLDEFEPDDDGVFDLFEDTPDDDETASGQSEDDTSTDDLNGTYQNGENEDHGDGCVDLAVASDRQVKVKTVIPGVDPAGDYGYNVHMCEPVDPMNPFGHLHSGFFLCPPWFGFEIHAGVWTVLGNAVGASTLVDGSFWFPMGAPPPSPFPVEFICDHASWHLMEDPVIPGQSSPHLHGKPALDLDAIAKEADFPDPYRQFP